MRANFSHTAHEKKLIERLLRLARQALRHAHSPYSGIKVGAAVLTKNGHVHTGCNVENASYGGTICAERVAISSAVASGDISPQRKITAILITTNQREIWPPCGICRQFLAEFSSPNTAIYCMNSRGQMRRSMFSEIFPDAFDAQFL